MFPVGIIAHFTFHMEEGTILFDTELVLYLISAQTGVPVPTLLASVTALSIVGSEVAEYTASGRMVFTTSLAVYQ